MMASQAVRADLPVWSDAVRGDSDRVCYRSGHSRGATLAVRWHSDGDAVRAPRQAKELMNEGNYDWHNGYVYLVLINNASQSVRMCGAVGIRNVTAWVARRRRCISWSSSTTRSTMQYVLSTPSESSYASRASCSSHSGAVHPRARGASVGGGPECRTPRAGNRLFWRDLCTLVSSNRRSRTLRTKFPTAFRCAR
jgi:hypothetical protein